jgi:hypothetical protein
MSQRGLVLQLLATQTRVRPVGTSGAARFMSRRCNVGIVPLRSIGSNSFAQQRKYFNSDGQVTAADCGLLRTKDLRGRSIDDAALDHDVQFVGDGLGKLHVLFN